MEENKWYVYKHIREDRNEPFYIGIGFIKNHKRAYESCGRSGFWEKISNKVSWHSEIIFDNLSEEEAKSKEIELIKFYGKIKNGGILCNITDGGDGTSGMKHTDKTKSIIREKRKNQIFTDETRRKLSKCQFGNKKAFGRKHTEDIRKLKSINQRGKFGGEIIRENIDGNIVIFSGIKDAADSINKTYKDIWYYCKHSNLLYHGYYWRYNNEKQMKNNDIVTKELLYNEYVINKKSGQKIGDELNCSGNKIYRLLKKYNLM